MSTDPSEPPSYQLSVYLEKQPGTMFKKLYQQPSTAFAIFRRMLPHLAKTIVMALLYMPAPLPLDDLDIWVRPGAKSDRDRALATLRSLHIVQITQPGKAPQQMQLSTNFKTSMRLALEGGGSHNSFGVPSALSTDPTVDTPFLDRYARKKWEDILHYVVNSVGVGVSEGGGYSGPKASVKDLLLGGRLIELRKDMKSGMGITQAGFTFLLQEANAQVWTLLLLWIDAATKPYLKTKEGDVMKSNMLSFLFMLATLEVGRAYDTDALSDERRNMLPSLVDFGLVYIPRDTPQQYYPTRLSTNLTSSSSALRTVSAGFSAVTANRSCGDTASLGAPASGIAEAKGSIIIETNYRIYAYTSSPLQIAVLALFAKLYARFGTMVSGRLSRESIRRAISYGITADQIISYLQAHAHEQMTRQAVTLGRPILPPTVVDQIRLWQLENERMKTALGFLFQEFESDQQYSDMAAFAEEIGVLLWKSDEKRSFFATKVEQLNTYFKAWNKQHKANQAGRA